QPNTTYYFRVASLNHANAKSTYTVLAATATLSFQPTSMGNLTFKQDDLKSTVQESSITVRFGRLPLASEHGSSMTSQGYLLEALSSSGVLYSSRTYSVSASTLTIGKAPDSLLERCAVYSFRVASYNLNGTTGAYTALGSTTTVEDWGTAVAESVIAAGSLELGTEYVIGTELNVTNSGNCPSTYWVRAATITAGSPWTISASSGTDTFTLQAAFNSALPVLGDFVEADKLTDTPAASS
ncbi:MAG: hypothetical protein AAB578_06355, partial [Elusimicrobiota bacterium]